MTKKCPYCAEDIQQEAIVCKHCLRDLVVVAGAAPPAAEFTVDIVDAKGNLKSGYLLAVAGLGLWMLWIPTRESFDSAGWLLLIGGLLFWFGMARTIKGSGIIRYGGSFLLACVTLAGIAYVSGPTLPSSPSGRFVMPQSIAGPAPVVTKAEFDQIREGMSYEDVARIIGASGELQSSSELAGIKTVMYAWMNTNGSNMNAMFQNGRLTQKAQFGLP